MDPMTIAMIGGSAANFISSLLGGRSQNRQRQQMIDTARETLEHLRSQGIQNPEAILQQLMGPITQFSNNVLGNAPWRMQNYLDQGQFDLLNFLNQTAPQLSMPGDMVSHYSSPLGDSGRRFDDILDFQRRQMMGAPDQRGFNEIIDRTTQFGRGEDQALAALLGNGNNLLDMQGTTGYNLNAQDVAGRGISGGGTSPYTEGIFGRGSALFDTGGYSPNLQQLSNFATQGLPGVMPGGANALTQSSVMGPFGTAAFGGLMGGIDPNLIPRDLSQRDIQGLLGMGMDSGYTPQNMTTWAQGTQGLQDLLNRNGQIDDVIGYAQQAFSGNLPGADQFGGQLTDIISQLAAGGGAGAIGGGGGASGASAGGMLATDPQMAEYIAQGLGYFRDNPLLSMDQMVGAARQNALSESRGQAERVLRYAKARGGGGGLINSGAQNAAMAEFADEEARNIARAVNDAMLRRQELGLQQQMRGGELGIAAQNADTNRQQVAASRDIASANNATQASIANSNAATQSAMAQAQMRNAALQAAASAALGARGQNYGRSQAGLQAMLDAQGLANQRGSIFGQAGLGALGDATTRQGNQLSIIPALLQSDVARGQTAADYNNQRFGTGLQGALTASQIAGNTNTSMLDILSRLGLGAEQGAASRIGLGLDAMQGAGGLAGQNLATYGQIGDSASRDQLARMGLGGTLLGQNIQGRLGALDLMGSAGTQQNNAMLGMGQLYNQTARGQSDIWNNIFGMDFANRQLGSQNYDNYFRNMLGLGSNAAGWFGMGLNPLTSLGNSMIGYMGGQQANATNLARGFLGGAPQQQNPWPQVNPSQWSGIFGGGGNSYGEYVPGMSNTPSSFNINSLLGFGGGPSLMTPPFVGSRP